MLQSEVGRIVSNERKETQHDQSDDGQTKSFLELVGRGLNDVISIKLMSDVSVTVHHWYNNINNQLDATITVY